MLSVLSGFLTIWIVIAAGWLLAHLKVLKADAQQVLSQVTFYVGSPALLMMMMSSADLHRIFAVNLLVSLIASISSGLIFWLITLVFWRRADRSSTILGIYSSCYVNAANLGIPIAAYVLKDVTWVAPILLIQVVLLQPIALSLLDAEQAREGGRTSSVARNLSLPLRNPMTIGTLIGLVVNLAGWKIPPVLGDPLGLLGALSVPCMLLAYGLSLRLGPLPGRGGQLPQTIVSCVLKLAIQPFLGWCLARAFGLDAAQTLAVTVIAGLPTAQNVFVWSVKYAKAKVLVRDVVFITTIASIPTVTAIAALVHA